MGHADIGLLVLSTASFITGALYLVGTLKQKNFPDTWNPLFITVSSCVDLINFYYYTVGKYNNYIINIYCLLEPFLFYLIWTKGRVLQRKPLIFFSLVYAIFIVLWIYEQTAENNVYTTYSTLWYSLFFSYIFVNKLADTIVMSFSNRAARTDFYFFLALILYLSFDVVMGLFDNYYTSLSDQFFRVKRLIKTYNMMVVYFLYTYYNVCKILKKTSLWPWGSA